MTQEDDPALLFPFVVPAEDVRQCILDTELALRDLVTTGMAAQHGPTWESGPHGFTDEERAELECLRATEQKRFPFQNQSDRLLDYTHIVQLKEIIARNWELFTSVFASKSETQLLLDLLAKLRNPEMHGRPGIPAHQKHLCLGICGEILAALETWRRGYRHKVQKWTVDLRFPAYEEDDDVAARDRASSRAADLAEAWLARVEQFGCKIQRQRELGEAAESIMIRLPRRPGRPSGHTRAVLRRGYRGFDGRYFGGADLHLIAHDLKSLGEVLKAGQSPYWVLTWTLGDDLDLAAVLTRARQLGGAGQARTTSLQMGDAEPVTTNASLRVGIFQGATLRVDLQRASRESRDGPSIGLVVDGAARAGFFRAHEVFSADLALEAVYGELSRARLQQLVNDACSPPVAQGQGSS